MIEEVRIRPLATPALLLGVGLGGWVVAIVLDEMLHWHMPFGELTSQLIELGLWVVTFVAAGMLFVAARRDDVVWSARIFVGAYLFGAGLAWFVDGLIGRLPLAGAGVVLMLVGFLIGRSEVSRSRMSPATRRALAL